MDRNLTRRARLTREIPCAPREKHRTKICPFCPFVLNDLVLSLLPLECPFRPVLCPFRPVFCPFCPSNKRLKLAETVVFLLRSQTVNMTKRVCRDCPIPNCGAKYLVKLSNHLTDVHALDYINRRKWLQEAKLQPKVKVMVYPAKRSQGLKRSRGETPLSVQEEEKDRIVHQLSTSRGVKKSLKSLPRNVGKAVNSIKHWKTTADSVLEWLTLYEDDEAPNTEKRA